MTKAQEITLLATEIKRRHSAANSLSAFIQFVMPSYEVCWYHRLIASRLDRVVSGEIKRLMIFTPPQHGKSLLVSKHFPAFCFGRNPDLKIVSASYSADLARSVNRDIQRIMDAEDYRVLFPNTKLSWTNVRTTGTDGMFLRNSDEFEICNYQGDFRSVGVGGGLTGRGFDVGIIDDPIKDRMEATSETYRNRIWDWYNAVFCTRRRDESAPIVLIQTRWHQDDLAGRLLARDKGEWTVLTIPAIREDTTCEYDPRKVGEALWPSRFPLSYLEESQAASPYDFASLYQQRPVPREGGMFKIARIPIMEEVNRSHILKSVRYWDKAGTHGAGCRTAGVLMHEMSDASPVKFILSDIVKGQWESGEREQRIRQTAELDGRNVVVWVEQEPGSGGKESAEGSIRRLAGFRVYADKVTGSKEMRADEFSVQANIGNVGVLLRDWTQGLMDELEYFPNGKYIDQCDAASGAFAKLAGNRKLHPHIGLQRETDEIQKLNEEIYVLERAVA